MSRYKCLLLLVVTLVILIRPLDWTVAQTPDFSLSLDQSSMSVSQGASQSGLITVIWLYGFSSRVYLGACFCYSTNQPVLPGGGELFPVGALVDGYLDCPCSAGGTGDENTDPFSVVALSSTPPDTYWLLITASSGQILHQIQIPVAVSQAPTNTVVTHTTSTTWTSSAQFVTTSTVQLTQYLGTTSTSTEISSSTTQATAMTTQTSIFTTTNSLATTSTAIQTSSSTSIVTSAIMSYLTESVTLTSTSIQPETSFVTRTTGVAPTTVTSTSQTLVPDYLLNDPSLLWIVSALFLIIGGALLFRFRSRIVRKPVTCSKCGALNPAYAERFCVKCGEPLSTEGYGKPD